MIIAFIIAIASVAAIYKLDQLLSERMVRDHLDPQVALSSVLIALAGVVVVCLVYIVWHLIARI
jgi:hypothetical protein